MILRIIVAVSLLLNAGLLISVVGFTSFFLYLSVLLNIGLVWYVFQLTSYVKEFQDDLVDMFTSIVKLENHMAQVYELETFYGDETLHDLLDHMSTAADLINEYNEKYNFSLDDEEEEFFEEEELDAETTETEQ
tara:strand:- start:422 stop:823 length:402 start_codon:yes stop_codon:yes gene_type:complete